MQLGLRRGGILLPAETEADEERVTSAHEVARKFQLRTRILNPQQIRDLVPELAGPWRSGLFTAGDAYGEPGVSTRTIANVAREMGAAFYEHEPVVEIDNEGGRIRGVLTLNGRCAAPTV